MTRPVITPGFWVGVVLAMLDLTRAHAWGTGEMGTYEHVGLLGHLPHHLVTALWTLAAILLLVKPWRERCGAVGLALTAGLHLSIGVSAAVAYVSAESHVLTSTVGSYLAIGVLTALSARRIDVAQIAPEVTSE